MVFKIFLKSFSSCLRASEVFDEVFWDRDCYFKYYDERITSLYFLNKKIWFLKFWHQSIFIRFKLRDRPLTQATKVLGIRSLSRKKCFIELTLREDSLSLTDCVLYVSIKLMKKKL
jgi:hypothetical protein